jgi:hypothetical protein
MTGQVTQWVPVDTQDGQARIRGDYGSVLLDAGAWSYFTPSQWEALTAKGAALLAGMLGRRAAGIAGESGGRVPGDFAADVAGTFPFPDQAPAVDAMTGEEWASVSRVLREMPGWYPVLRACWEQALAEAEAAGQDEPRYCPTCSASGNDDSRLGRDRVFNVEGAGPDGLLADVCEFAGHVFPVINSDEEEG